MRHVRMRILGLGLITALVAAAIGAGSAWASKDPFTNNTWGQYKGCPFENEELTDCFYGRTAGGSEGGEFKYGHVTVKLSKPVIIQGGFKGAGSTIEVAPATHGFESLESPELTVSKGLAVITPQIEEQAEWPQALKESFNAAKKAKETKAFVKIETAGDECFTVPGCLDTEDLLFEEGTAFRLALKVKVTNSWLAKLGGVCQIGSDEHPIMQHLSSEGAGRAGELSFSEEFTNLELKGSELVDTSWHIPLASGANGCGGPENEKYLDRALNLALEVAGGNGEEFERTGKTGITWLTGDLHDAARAAVVTEGVESGEIP